MKKLWKIKKYLTTTILLVSVLFSVGAPLLAAEDQFIVGQEVTASPDIVAPSVPTDLIATAVSASQINLSWTASTDNVAVSGYQVFRDGDFLATSSIVTYSDTGLTAETLYSYTVTAFDTAINISAESDPATATTLAAPVTGDDTTGSQGGGLLLRLRHLSVLPEFTRAILNFGVTMPAQAVVSWGKTADYELGSSASTVYLKDHVVLLDDLVPSTRYFFKIYFVDGYGRHLLVENQEFTTPDLPDVYAPTNVSNFMAKPSENDITLTWKNPKIDFEKVRIVKSEKFYPRDPSEGEIIYEGRGEKYIDRDVVVGVIYYYTAFSVDSDGNFSSGAVTDGKLVVPGEEPTSPKLFAGVLQLAKELIHPLLQKLSVADIDFFQDGKKLPVVDGTVEIKGDRNLTVSIDYAKVPEILKTIVVTMFDPEDKEKTFSFLLRVNEDKTAYEANIAPLDRPGKYEFSLGILDHKHQGLALLAGTIISRLPEIISGDGGRLGNTSFGLNSLLMMLLILLLLLIVMKIILRGKKRKNSAPAFGPTFPDPQKN